MSFFKIHIRLNLSQCISRRVQVLPTMSGRWPSEFLIYAGRQLLLFFELTSVRLDLFHLKTIDEASVLSCNWCCECKICCSRMPSPQFWAKFQWLYKLSLGCRCCFFFHVCIRILFLIWFIIFFLLLDYIHDNCEGGRNERFHFHCNIMLAADTFYNLTSKCNEMDGQLTWFDTTDEYNRLMNRVRYYDLAASNSHLYTGELYKQKCVMHTIS